MNRLRIWVYALVVLAAGAAGVVSLSRWLTARSVAQLDRELHAAVGQLDVRTQLLAADAAQLAEVVARDPDIAEQLATKPGGDIVGAAQAALQSARHTPGGDARPVLVAVGTRSGVVARAAGAPAQLDADGAALVSGATARRVEGYLFAGDGLWYVVGVPAGEGAAIAIGLPIDASWLAAARTSTGWGLTLIAEGHKERSTLGAGDLATVLAAA